MLKKKTKHSCTRHQEVGAAIYCKECRMFMCAEDCQVAHDNFFGKMHHTILVDSLTDFDLRGGMCAIHKNYILDFVCKDCNSLCCMKCYMEDAHSKHKVIPVEEADPYLKALLDGCLIELKEKTPILEEAPEKLYEKHEKDKSETEKIKTIINECFMEARKALDEKENEVLAELERLSSNAESAGDSLGVELQSFTETLYPTYLSATNLESQWDEVPISAEKANNVMSVSSTINTAKEFSKRLNACKGHKIRFGTDEFKEKTKGIVSTISGLKLSATETYTDSGPEDFVVDRIGVSFVNLSWKKTELDSEYCVAEIKKEEREKIVGNEWAGRQTFVNIDNWHTVCQLRSDTEYLFRVKAKRNGVWSNWSEVASGKTKVPSIEAVVDDLSEVFWSKEACIDLCNLLISLLENVNGPTPKKKLSAIGPIAKAMNTYLEDAGVCISGCDALKKIVSEDGKLNQYFEFTIIIAICKADREFLRETDAIQAVINTINMHSNNAEVCCAGFDSLRIFTIDDVNEKTAAAKGAIEAVALGMCANSDNIDVCKKGLLALKNMTVDADNQAICGRVGAIDAILIIFNTHLNDPTLCTNAFYVLMNITVKEGNREYIGRTQAIKIVTNALRRHMHEPEICKEGCKVFLNFAANNQTNKEHAKRDGAIDVVLDILLRYKDTKQVASIAVKTLERFMHDVPSNKEYIKSIVSRNNKLKPFFNDVT